MAPQLNNKTKKSKSKKTLTFKNTQTRRAPPPPPGMSEYDSKILIAETLKKEEDARLLKDTPNETGIMSAIRNSITNIMSPTQPAPDAMPPAPDAMPPAPDAMPPAPDAMPPAPDAMPPAPDAMPPAPDAMPPAPDAMPPVPDAMPPAPDAMPPAPDAMPPAPDAMPPAPDAMPPAPAVNKNKPKNKRTRKNKVPVKDRKKVGAPCQGADYCLNKNCVNGVCVDKRRKLNNVSDLNAPQEAAPQEAAPQEAAPQEAAPQRLLRKRLLHRRLLHRRLLPEAAPSDEEDEDDEDDENKREKKEYKSLDNKSDEFSYLYPSLNDPNFNVKIAEKKEFYDTRYDGRIFDIEEHARKLCDADFELAPHQLFVRNFLSFQTPYNSLLLYHGLGSGKTCSAIGVAEEMRDYHKQMGITNRIIVVAAPNVQDNFKLQLFDERKLSLIDGMWNITACVGNKLIKEINPMNMKGLDKASVVRQIKKIITKSYLFLGYIEFANYIKKNSSIATDIKDDRKLSSLVKKKLKQLFNNRLIIIDEIHNIRMTDDNENKLVATELTKLIRAVDNVKLLMLSATPMYNSYKEIVWLVNIMNINDNRPEMAIKDVFNTDGTFVIDENGIETGKELLERKATGYVSYVRGDNPYTFPYRIWPKDFSPENTFEQRTKPERQLNGSNISQPLEILDLFLSDIGEYQKKGYKYIIDQIRTKANRKDAPDVKIPDEPEGVEETKGSEPDSPTVGGAMVSEEEEEEESVDLPEVKLSENKENIVSPYDAYSKWMYDSGDINDAKKLDPNNVIKFNSGAILPYYKLSNFYDVRNENDGKMGIEYPENSKNYYPSSEHIYQSLKFPDSKERFQVNGDLGNFDSGFKCLYKNPDEIKKKINYWSKKKQVGIIAKMVSTKKNFNKCGLQDPIFPEQIIFEDILKQKYKITSLKNILVNTEQKYLLEHSKQSQRNWNNNKIIDHMGWSFGQRNKYIIWC